MGDNSGKNNKAEAKMKNEEKTVLEADTVFLLMKKGFPISRNVRAQWMLEHLDSLISIQCPNVENEEALELEIVSILPTDKPPSWSIDTSHKFLYKVTSATCITFLAHRYRIVFNLDLSPSLATIDVQHGEIVVDEVCLATKRCFENIIKPFAVPGSKRVIRPEIYVTVIAHSPFFMSPAQQILVQGWLLTMENVNHLIRFIEKQLNILEEKVASATAVANQELENLKADDERLVGGLFEEGGTCLGKSSSSCVTNNSMVSPEASFINMLRYGMLALTLLPEHSCAHLVVVTDGVVGVTDIHVLDSVIQQLRATTVACSFIHVGSSYHPHCGDGLVPYQDLLCFLATATLGSYMTFIPNSVPECEPNMNIYHKNYLCWQLYKDLLFENIQSRRNSWQSTNAMFHGHKPVQLLRKKQIDDKVICTLSSLLCCRLREGYLIKRAIIRDEVLEICFVLLWKTNVVLEYLVTCPWSIKSLSISNTILYTITIEAPYEFLHDITCLSKKPLKSQYRQGVVSRFWAALTSLTESDNMLAHFSWNPGSGWTWYSVPDTVRSGMPVFYLSAYPSPSTVQLSDAACPQFGQIWQPVVSLDPPQWARWMHSQRITLILSHDRPLPRHIHQANQSGRFQCVQCRQAAAVLYAMLKNWATFVLVENHTYVQFIYREVEKPPVSFSLIRINCKALCVVLNIAFAGGTEGVVRHNVVVELVERLSKLTLPNRPMEQRETPCCTIIHKSLERILIRYERMPTDLSVIVFPDGTQPSSMRSAPMQGGSLTTTLSRYLYHNRWLWHVRRPFVQTIPGITLPQLNITSIARVLSTITKMRLAEGFNFAYSAAGIINMVLEVQMEGLSNSGTSYPCIIQYILFPPHFVANTIPEHDSGSDEDTDEGTVDGEVSTEEYEGSGDFQIVTEMWIEPQYGYAYLPAQRTAMFMHGLQYHKIPDAVAAIDEECVNSLLTLEYLSLLCQEVPPEKCMEIVFGQVCQGPRPAEGVAGSMGKCGKRLSAPECFERPLNIDERIHPMHFSFDTLGILPKCQQAELLFSMFTNGYSDAGKESADKILMDGFLHHIKRLHSKELLLTSDESQKFTKLLLKRPRDEDSCLPFFSQTEGHCDSNDLKFYPRWRCYIKGISATHVIVTILPASERDVRLLMTPRDEEGRFMSDDSEKNYFNQLNLQNNEINCFSSPGARQSHAQEPLQRDELTNSSQCTSAPSTPKEDEKQHFNVSGCKEGLVIPVYVYDCSLALLIDALVDKLQSPRSKDIYQDHTLRIGQQNREDFVHLKTGSISKPPSPEPKSEDSDNIACDQRGLMEHCKLLSLAHCHCYVVAVYKSLALQQPLSYEDMEAAVEQCEEILIEINITNYLRSVCRHLNDSNLPNHSKVCTCTDVRALHNLIKNKFERIMTIAFRPVPAHPEFYYCSPSWTAERMDLTDSGSDDDLEDFTFHSEIIDYKKENSAGKGNQTTNATWPSTNLHNLTKLTNRDSTDSLVSDLQEENTSSKEHPLFLQLSCSVHSSSGLYSIPVKFLPTCFHEIIQKMDDCKEKNVSDFAGNNLKVTLDIICLNLPKEVLEVNLERATSVRTTSYCSASPVGSLRTENGSSPGNETQADPLQERMSHLPVYQHNAIANLTDEIEWLLQDETATALLDTRAPTEETLKFVARHVSESSGRFSCFTDKVPLYFVFPSESSGPKFLEELKELRIDKYCTRQEGNWFYVVKNVEDTECILGEDKTDQESEEIAFKEDASGGSGEHDETVDVISHTSKHDSSDPPGCYSEISSITEEKPGTDDGYEGDSSNSEDDFHWLNELDKRRSLLPNFWLILSVESNFVNVYFHCRFLELACPEVNHYCQVQKMLVTQIKAICRRVNQYLLLQNLHDKRMCDPLLESESSEDHNWRTETTTESGGLFQNQNSGINVTPGMFRCPVVWDVQFCLHPRLKTGPGRSGLSRGVKALHGVLNRLSVNNRNNMFVYQETNGNVVYLRLHEQTNDGKSLQNKLSESDEKLVVSRSNSVASLTQAKGIMNDSLISIDTRPRVRSFGEKESDILNKTGDSILLKVHGIAKVGVEVQKELVQVLQNRLDDAVLEVLSVMLARNPMCKLSPDDVHFIQKPYRPPECVIQLSVPPHCWEHIGALGYYLRQNVLQFLYIPKYTDHRDHHCHFQDYSQPEGSSKRVADSDILLYNQSHSSGNKGIACIAFAITNSKGEPIAKMGQATIGSNFPSSLKLEDFNDMVFTTTHEGKTDTGSTSQTLLEFRIWKQGRVNMESLLQKLRSSVRHAIWDLVTEYHLLSTVLTEPTPNDLAQNSTNNREQTTGESSVTPYELGEKGKLNTVYHTTLPKWLQFALEIGVPAVKKHDVIIYHRHAIPMIVKELQNLIRNQTRDTSCKTFVLDDRQPFLTSDVAAKGSGYVLLKSDNDEQLEPPVYVPCDFNREELGTYIKCILIARNFHQWKASFSATILPDQLVPKDQKLLQKYNPLILETSFVPRQRILLGEVQSDSITLYMYNWSKEKSEKLIKQTTNLGTWLSSRSSLYSNIVMQKLGIFHHQPMPSYQQREPGNLQYYQITDMESLAKFPHGSDGEGKEWPRTGNRAQPLKNPSFSWNQLVGQAMRDAKPSTSHTHNTTDPIVKAAYDLQNLRHREKKTKEDLNRLYAMYQSRNTVPNIPIPQATLNTFKQYSRLIHYCHTPLLFLPAWRLQSAATRDHSLTPPTSLASSEIVHQQFSQQAVSKDQTGKTIPSWHQELCQLMLSEYKQYLQLLGCNPIQIESPHRTSEDIAHQSYYLKKSMLGGVLLFEIHLSEPFFIVKLRTIECSRLQVKPSSGLANQFMLSFVDACDKMKINIHLHSFTYDFHLRCIHSYIAGTSPWSLQQGYHLTHFLDDFNKYYSKAPNFARNLIYSDFITIRNLATPARTLYSYLLSHEKTYGMHVFVMSNEPEESQDSEYVLVKIQSTPLVSYCDAQDTKYTDDFDVALIVSRVEQSPQQEKTDITLKYYLMLTSKRELYPKREVENNKLGKFRTVYSVSKSANNSHGESPSGSSPISPIPSFKKVLKNESGNNSETDIQESNPESDGSVKENDIKTFNGDGGNIAAAPIPPPVPNSPLAQSSNILSPSASSNSPHLMQIRQESINYLGYYSSHEQLMQQMIMTQAQAARQHITNMIERGASQCRTHLLWNRLLENKSTMSYSEFMELCSLAHVEPLSKMDSRLAPLVSQPVSWYQALAKVLQNKYQEHHKQFNAPDGNVTHHLILHPGSLQAFMMLTIDLHTSRGELCAVYRKCVELANAPYTMEDVYTLIEGFVNACCFHLWVGLCT